MAIQLEAETHFIVTFDSPGVLLDFHKLAMSENESTQPEVRDLTHLQYVALLLLAMSLVDLE